MYVCMYVGIFEEHACVEDGGGCDDKTIRAVFLYCSYASLCWCACICTVSQSQ